MNILGIESSAISAGAAVLSGGELVAEFFLCTGLTHSQTLMPLIDSVLNMAGITVPQLDVIAVSNGPGSFTGLRIGVGTAKGIAFGAGKKVVGVSPLLSLAYNISPTNKIILPIMDARRGEVYNGVYKYKNGKPVEVTLPRALPIDELMGEFYGQEVIFVGDGVPVYKTQIMNTMKGTAAFPPEHLLHQRASSVAKAAESMAAVPPEELVPKYIRKPQAQREYEERENANIRGTEK